jgi:hypothetical protein
VSVIKGESDRGIVSSGGFPGLWLAVDGLLTDTMQQVLAVLQQGIDGEEHQGFVRTLVN